MSQSAARIFLIAEAGVNHNGSVDRAMQMVEVAAAAGADAVKFQTFRAVDLASMSAARAQYQVRNTGSEGSQVQMLRELELDAAAHARLAGHCRATGIEFMSSPFSADAVRILVDELKVRRIKIPSGEIDNPILLLEVARTRLPVILSTGMSTLGDIEWALGVLAYGYSRVSDPPSRRAFRQAYGMAMSAGDLYGRVSILQCTSQYPAPDEEINLEAIGTLREAFGLPVGFSDHSAGIAIPIAAAALGAAVIEKHFTLDRTLPGPDHAASLEPDELREMIAAVRRVERARGTGRKSVAASEVETRSVARRSLVAARHIRRGETFTEANLAAKRPGIGVAAMEYWDWIGRRAGRDYEPDDLVDL